MKRELSEVRSQRSVLLKPGLTSLRGRRSRRRRLAVARPGSQSSARLPLASPHHFATPGALRHRARRAFTLLEVIIVIGIIVLLTALTVTIAVGVTGRNDIRHTENVLKLLDLAMSEWQQEADRQITWGVNGEPAGVIYDIQPDTPQKMGANDEPSMLNIVLDKLQRHPAANSILRQIDGKYLRLVEVESDPENPRLDVVDAWENQIYVIHPGRIADGRTFADDAGVPGIFRDEDGTIRVCDSETDADKNHPAVGGGQGWECILGVCKNRRICFVSAGPDGDFGDLTDDPTDTESEYEDTLDNIYSYPVGKP